MFDVDVRSINNKVIDYEINRPNVKKFNLKLSFIDNRS